MRRFAIASFLLGFASCVHVPRVSETVLLTRASRHAARERLELAPSSPVAAETSRLLPPAAHEDDSRAVAVVLVTLDGVRWQDVFEGSADLHERDARVPVLSREELVPTLTRWATVEGSAVGAPTMGEMRASGPNYVSLPGYTELMTGAPPRACQSNFCAQVSEPTLLDDVRLGLPDERVAAISSWEPIARALGPRLAGFELSTGRLRSLGVPEAWLTRGRRANAWPGEGDYRPDAFTEELALRVLERDTPAFLFVGLGDTDEHAHHGDVEAYAKALAGADAFLAKLESKLEQMGERGRRTAVLVTCDHGRNEGFRDHGGQSPESGRVWLVAKGAGVGARGEVHTRGRTLSDVRPTVRKLLGVTEGAGPDEGRAIDEIIE